MDAAMDNATTGKSLDEGQDEIPASLRPLADALARTATVEEVGNALVQVGLPTLGACVAVLALLSDDGTEFYCPRIAGYPDEVADAWRRFPADASMPICDAVRQNRLVLLETLESRLAYYSPATQMPNQVGRALAAIPMRRGKVIGGLGFAFPDDRDFQEVDRAVLFTVAALCAEALERARRRGLGCEVLVVEDEPRLLVMVDSVLRFHAFTVRQAPGGEQAVRVYERHHATIDVVLMDVQMPGMDGPQTLAALQRIATDVRCVFMSGDTGAYTAEDLFNRGAVRLLSKPFSSLDGLMRTLLEVATEE
jgi:CheY-like chemotaxis protein